MDLLNQAGIAPTKAPRSNRAPLVVAGMMSTLSLFGCKEEKAAVTTQPPVVRTALVQVSDSAQDLALSGQLDADVSVAVSFASVGGTIQKVLVNEGQAVRQGQVLAVLDAGSQRDQLATAQAKARQADDAYARLEPMHRNGTVTEVKWVEVETGRDQARSMVSMAARNLEDATLKAPLSGIVAKRSIEPGEQATPGLSAFTIVQTGTMLATVAVPEKDIARLKPGTKARVSISALDRTTAGTVREIGVQADPLTRTYKVKVALPNPDGALKIGMVADVRLNMPGRKGIPIAPQAAVQVDEAGHNFLWVLSDAKVHHRTVKLGGYLKEGIAIDSGLSAGESVVVSGTPMLSEGLAVQVGK